MTAAELSVEIAPKHPVGLRIPNPVMIASGTFGYDGYGRGLVDQAPLPSHMDFQRLGAVVAKTVTMKPRTGNPEPRWWPMSYRRAMEEGDTVFLNSVGLTNPGIHAALEELAPVWAGWDVPVFFSLAGESVHEFGVMTAMADGIAGIAAIELNLSCPNVDNGAHFSHSAELAGATVARVKDSTGMPVLAKLSPNVPDISPIAEAVADAGADAVVLTNTIPAMTIDVDTQQPILGGVTGGLSGPALRPVAVALVYRASQAVDIPIIGVGGIFTARDALEFIVAGATAVQVGSANLAGLHHPMSILDELESYLENGDIACVGQLKGASRRPLT